MINKKLKILIERKKRDGDLAVYFYLPFFKKKKLFRIERTDELLEIFNDIFGKKRPLNISKIELKFKGNVGLLNKRIAKAIVKALDFI